MWGNVQWGRWWRTTRSCFPQHFWTSHVRPNQFQQIRVYHSVSGYRAASCNMKFKVWRLPAIPLPWTLMKVSRYPSWSFLWMMLRYAYTIFGWGEGVETHPEWQQGKMQLYFQPSLLLIYLPFVRSYPCLSDSITNSCTPKVDQMETPKCLGNIMPISNHGEISSKIHGIVKFQNDNSWAHLAMSTPQGVFEVKCSIRNNDLATSRGSQLPEHGMFGMHREKWWYLPWTMVV